MSDILIWRRPNLEKFMREIVAWQGVRIWDLTMPRIKKLMKTHPLFLVCFLDFFYQKHGLASNPDSLSWDHFKIFLRILAPKIKIFEIIYVVITLSRYLNILAFKFFMKIYFLLKNRHFGNVVWKFCELYTQCYITAQNDWFEKKLKLHFRG